MASHLDFPGEGNTWHTNHCLTPEVTAIENRQIKNPTSHYRYDLIEKKITGVQSLEDLRELLGDHENYPRSICTHFEGESKDPGFTCGGGIVELTGKRSLFWKGCRIEDKNYGEYAFDFEEVEGKTEFKSYYER